MAITYYGSMDDSTVVRAECDICHKVSRAKSEELLFIRGWRIATWVDTTPSNDRYMATRVYCPDCAKTSLCCVEVHE